MKRQDYPTLDEASIKIVASRVKENPDYLNHSACPYADSTINVFQGTRKQAIVNDIDEVKQTLRELRDQLKLQSDRFDSGDLEPSEANAYLKTRFSLTEKILEMEEKVRNIDKVEEFYATVMSIMEDELEAHQSSAVMAKLQKITGMET